LSEIRIVELLVNEELKVSYIDGSLDSMQDIVGGNIESVGIKVDNSYVDLIVNEEGKLTGLPFNFNILVVNELVDVVVGNCFITGHDEEGEARSLTDNEINGIRNLFKDRHNLYL
jgi:hypothetical protein